MESFEDGLRRFLSAEREAPLTLLVWGQNVLLHQLGIVREKKFEDMIFLSTHAFIQAFSEIALGKVGRSATLFFLKEFMDGAKEGQRFSLIGDEIHEMRNVIAHQVFSSRTHRIAIDYTITDGWKKEPNLLHINPEIFALQFEAALNGGRLWKWHKFVTKEDAVKRQYSFVCNWLDLPKSDPISRHIATLEKATTIEEIRRLEKPVKQEIEVRYNL
ncbi:MAG: hypothetical protein WAL32_08110 [Terriglobales bacterium]